MKPLCIQATVNGPISIPYGYLHLDALLAYAVCLEQDIPPAYLESELVPVEIPIQRSECGRYHLCSSSEVTWAELGMRYTQRRFPIEQAQGMSKMRRVQITAGACKSYRVPYESNLPEGPITFWGIGEMDDARRLLSYISHLGKKRSVGNGNVSEWKVFEVAGQDLWPGFPVLRDGFPLRHLPLDTPDVNAEALVRIGCLTFPYWLTAAETEVFAPDVAA